MFQSLFKIVIEEWTSEKESSQHEETRHELEGCKDVAIQLLLTTINCVDLGPMPSIS